MDKRFLNILQLGIIVRDVDKAIRNYEKYGIGPWEILEFGPTLFEKMLIDNEPGMLSLKIGFCKCFDNIELEIIQPVSESKYVDYLNEHGPGLHHIAVSTPDNNSGFHPLINEEARRGKKPWIWMKEDNGKERVGMEAAYLDLREELGLIVEIYNEDR